MVMLNMLKNLSTPYKQRFRAILHSISILLFKIEFTFALLKKTCDQVVG